MGALKLSEPEWFRNFDGDARTALVSAARIRRFSAREDLAAEGEIPAGVHFLLSGWACQYRMLEDGRRQVLALNLPGDNWGFSLLDPQAMDHSVAALTPVMLAQIPHWRMTQLALDHESIWAAMHGELLRAGARQRQWSLSLGRRNASQRVGHLLCETFVRLLEAEVIADHGCDFPITQVTMGEAMGLTSVHVNRILQELRSRGLIALRNRRLQILDFDRLKRESAFTEAYLA